jgi:FKBP12-rapamycin complex-associated protein
MISEELIRTAILLKEIWSEGIEEAWKHYSNDKNFEATLRVLNSLHDRMKETPESLNEITFH